MRSNFESPPVCEHWVPYTSLVYWWFDRGRCQGWLFDPEFNPDMSLTMFVNMVLCATYVFDGFRRNAVAPGAMQGEASLTHSPCHCSFTYTLPNALGSLMRWGRV